MRPPRELQVGPLHAAKPTFFKKRAMRPTGNCSPALADLVTLFLPLLPLPRPDMVALVEEGKGVKAVADAADKQRNGCSEVKTPLTIVRVNREMTDGWIVDTLTRLHVIYLLHASETSP
jgi:hypothetical protein